MSEAEIVAFLPCRLGSERVPRKNVRMFAGVEGGLLSIKLGQLTACRTISTVVVSTNDPAVADIAHAFAKNHPERIKVLGRPDHLGSSQTSTDDLIAYVPEIIKRGHVLWTHVTSPFVDAADYEAFVDAYLAASNKGEADSLMTVTSLRTFLWGRQGPINYDRAVEHWPRTQTLEPVFEVNSAAFIAPISVYKEMGDRIGKKPLLFELEKSKSVDVDWPEDFELAEKMWELSSAVRG